MLKPEVFSHMLIHQHLSHLAIAAGMLVLVAMAWWPTRCRPPRRRRASMSSRCWWSIRACRRIDEPMWMRRAPMPSLDRTIRRCGCGRCTAAPLDHDPHASGAGRPRQSLCGGHEPRWRTLRWGLDAVDRAGPGSRFPCSPATGRWSRGLSYRMSCSISPSRVMAAIWQPGLVEHMAFASMTARQTGAKSPGMSSMAVMSTAWRFPRRPSGDHELGWPGPPL